MYSSLCGSPGNALEYQNSPFCQGIRLLEQGGVNNVLQVGECSSSEARIDNAESNCKEMRSLSIYVTVERNVEF